MVIAKTNIQLLLTAILLVGSAVAVELPVSFMSAQHPKSLLLKMEVRPET